MNLSNQRHRSYFLYFESDASRLIGIKDILSDIHPLGVIIQ